MTTTAIARRLTAIRDKSALDVIDIATATGAEPDAVSRWNQSEAMPRPGAQRRLLDLEYIVDMLSDIYDRDEVKLWLMSKQKLLGGQIPLDLIQAGKTDEVIAIVDQIRDGVFV